MKEYVRQFDEEPCNADMETCCLSGGKHRPDLFRGVYYKLVAPNGAKLAVIPGIFKHPDDTHAFIQTLDGATGESAYHRYPAADFHASTEQLDVRLGGCHFRHNGVTLDLPGIQGEVAFTEVSPWPVSLLAPGVMGPFAFVPFMQCYHGVLSFDHGLRGDLVLDGVPTSFDGGRGYLEKDWGRAFPRAYVWMQSNHFEQEGVSITGSIATIPWMGTWFRGLIFGVWVEPTLYRFTTYTGNKILSHQISADHVEIELEGGRRTHHGPGGRFKRYHLHIVADRAEGGTLAAPEPVGMIERVVESLTATIHIRLTGHDGTVIVEGTGQHGGLEVSGSVEEIIDM